MAQFTHGRVARQLQHLRASFAQQPGLPFADLLPDDTAERLGPSREPVYTPLVTLQLFLGQVLDPMGSSSRTVGRPAVLAAAVTARRGNVSARKGSARSFATRAGRFTPMPRRDGGGGVVAFGSPTVVP